jgi:hypothetical protein
MFRKPTIRLASLIVLLVSGSDYWAYDRWDPTAPMNSSGPQALALFVSQVASGVSLRCSNLPDDHCLCCSPLVVPPVPMMPLGCFGSSLDLVYSAKQSAWNLLSARHSVPARDPTGFNRPLRV